MATRHGQSRLIVVPVYNEAPSVAKVLQAIREAAPDADVLVIDDGSTDGTSEILDEWMAKHSGVALCSHDHNLGYGQTLIDGFTYAVDKGYEFLLTIDCDEQHEPQLIPRFFQEVVTTDVVSGSRYLEEDRREAPPPGDRRAINRTVTGWIRERTGYSITDAFCGFKAYRVDALRRLSLSETGYGMPLQLWLQAATAGLDVREIPVPLIYKSNFERRFGGGLDDSEVRLNYYRSVLKREEERLAMHAGPVPRLVPKSRPTPQADTHGVGESPVAPRVGLPHREACRVPEEGVC